MILKQKEEQVFAFFRKDRKPTDSTLAEPFEKAVTEELEDFKVFFSTGKRLQFPVGVVKVIPKNEQAKQTLKDMGVKGITKQKKLFLYTLESSLMFYINTENDLQWIEYQKLFEKIAEKLDLESSGLEYMVKVPLGGMKN